MQKIIKYLLQYLYDGPKNMKLLISNLTLNNLKNVIDIIPLYLFEFINNLYKKFLMQRNKTNFDVLVKLTR